VLLSVFSTQNGFWLFFFPSWLPHIFSCFFHKVLAFLAFSMFGIFFGMRVVRAFVCICRCFPCIVPVFHVYCHTCFCIFFCVVHILASSQCLVSFDMHRAAMFAGFLCVAFLAVLGMHLEHIFSHFFSLCLILACFSIQHVFHVFWHASIACFCTFFPCLMILVRFSVRYAFGQFWHVSTTCFMWNNMQKHF